MSPLARPGDTIAGRYRIVRPLGVGSVAEVFAAHDDKRDRDVALKIVRSHMARDPESLNRLDREAKVQQMIRHPNVAKLYGGGLTERNEPYLVVELLNGRSLRDVVQRERWVSSARAAGYAWQALQGLAATHEVGVLHRDLKPANLMLEPVDSGQERVVLIDFGFAALEGSTRLTAQGHVVGSLAYLAPERLMGEAGDERSDLYALGVILYELCAGRRPFVAETDLELINLHLEEQPAPPRVVAPEREVDPALESILLAALSKDPGQRPRSAMAMAESLAAAGAMLPAG
ncbi:MAG TPA: serine/threonine-protein kinase [Kofleriaceae bacterium]|nr:serine/threonine-protein kinase [Kofleriaceae bacterium]